MDLRDKLCNFLAQTIFEALVADSSFRKAPTQENAVRTVENVFKVLLFGESLNRKDYDNDDIVNVVVATRPASKVQIARDLWGKPTKAQLSQLKTRLSRLVAEGRLVRTRKGAVYLYRIPEDLSPAESAPTVVRITPGVAKGGKR